MSLLVLACETEPACKHCTTCIWLCEHAGLLCAISKFSFIHSCILMQPSRETAKAEILTHLPPPGPQESHSIWQIEGRQILSSEVNVCSYQ